MFNPSIYDTFHIFLILTRFVYALVFIFKQQQKKEEKIISEMRKINYVNLLYAKRYLWHGFIYFLRKLTK